MLMSDRVRGLSLLYLDEFRYKWTKAIFQYRFYSLMFYTQKYLPQLLVNKYYKTKWVPKWFYIATYMIYGKHANTDFTKQVAIFNDTVNYVGNPDHLRAMVSSQFSQLIEDYYHHMEQICKELLQYLKENKIKHTLWLL